jgi:hypothetical protein
MSCVECSGAHAVMWTRRVGKEERQFCNTCELAYMTRPVVVEKSVQLTKKGRRAA